MLAVKAWIERVCMLRVTFGPLWCKQVSTAQHAACCAREAVGLPWVCLAFDLHSELGVAGCVSDGAWNLLRISGTACSASDNLMGVALIHQSCVCGWVHPGCVSTPRQYSACKLHCNTQGMRTLAGCVLLIQHRIVAQSWTQSRIIAQSWIQQLSRCLYGVGPCTACT